MQLLSNDSTHPVCLTHLDKVGDQEFIDAQRGGLVTPGQPCIAVGLYSLSMGIDLLFFV